MRKKLCRHSVVGTLVSNCHKTLSLRPCCAIVSSVMASDKAGNSKLVKLTTTKCLPRCRCLTRANVQCSKPAKRVASDGTPLCAVHARCPDAMVKNSSPTQTTPPPVLHNNHAGALQSVPLGGSVPGPKTAKRRKAKIAGQVHAWKKKHEAGSTSYDAFVPHESSPSYRPLHFL